MLFQPGASDFLLVTFGPLNIEPEDRPWGRRFIQKLEWNALGFVDKRRSWYPAAAMEPALAAAAPILSRFRAIVLYGSSMGAYAALKYSSRLGGNCVVAFAPQFSIDPADVRSFDERFLTNFDPDRHGDMAIGAGDVSGDAFVFYDPLYREDSYNLERIKAVVPSVQPIAAPATHHFPIELFAGTQRIADLIWACRLNDRKQVQAMVHRLRRESPIRTQRLLEWMVTRNIDKAAILVDRYGGRLDMGELAWVQGRIAERLLALGHLDQAQAILERALKIRPRTPAFLHWMSQIRTGQGDEAGAVDWARRLIAAGPDNPHHHQALAAALQAFDRLEEAETALRDALALVPNNVAVLCDMARARAHQGGEDAADWLDRAASLDPGSPQVANTREALAHAADQPRSAEQREEERRARQRAALRKQAYELTGLGKFDGAEAAARSLIEIDPTDGHAYNALAGVLIGANSLDEAEAALLTALRLAPDTSDFMRRLTAIYQRRDDLPGALIWANRAVEAAPDYCYTHINLSNVLLQAGDFDAARQALETARKVAPDNTARMGQA
jgi:tetratricopeptide (TPR) repeat protein